MLMFMAALFTIARTWKQPTCCLLHEATFLYHATYMMTTSSHQ